MDMAMDLHSPSHSLVKQEMELVQCAVCKVEMSSVDFAHHNMEMHNCLSWTEGTMPLDLDNEKIVLSMLNKALKSKKRKVLSCEICGEEKKSAVGFFTHRQVCGKTAEEKEQMRITCDVCGKSMMPVSLRSHMVMHQRKTVLEEFQSAASPVVSCPTTPSTPGSSRGDHSGKKTRRAAATRAKSRMSYFLREEAQPTQMSPPKQIRLFSDMKASEWDSAPRLLQTWRGFISLTGAVMCVYGDCPFRADSIESIRNHISNCEFGSSHETRFLCNICLQQQRDESDMVTHIQTEHESKESNESGDLQYTSERESVSDSEMESHRAPIKRTNRQTPRAKPPGPQRAFNKMRFLQNTVTVVGKELDIYPAALKWTFEFRLANYTENVFPSLTPDMEECIFLDEREASHYIPSTLNSIPIEFSSSAQESPDPPHHFSLFEGQIIDGVSTFFSGGPVWAMEWCPIPMNICLAEDSPPSEYLAVSTHHNMDDTFCVPKSYSFPNIIQIWDCGNLSSRNLYQRPKLALALAHDYGTVWSLAWCPSGAFDIETKSYHKKNFLKRLGLLAAACSSGNVHVFSVPFPDQLKTHLHQKSLPVYKSQPLMTLANNFTEPSQCTRVTWYSGQGHGLVAAGYCNGMVALWDLKTLPPLLWDAQNRILKPFQCFQAHLTVVSALSFNPEYEGRFFMTGSHDRGIKFWDMEDLSAPITHHRRGYVTDGVWVNLWISTITSYDDAFQHEHTNSTLHPVRDFGYKPYPLLTQNSVAWCLAYNEWINATAQGTEAGEVVVTFSSQLMRGLDNEKNAIDRRIMASYTLLKKIAPGENVDRQLGEVVLWKPQPKKTGKVKAKKPVKSSKGKGKHGPQEEEGEESEIAASLYTPEAILQDRNPQFYADIEKNYGICVHDTVRSDSNKSKLPEEAKSRVRISGKMHPTCSDYYPITSINKVAWNPNIGRFFWLATGHQCGLVRITGMHFMENSTYSQFLVRASETLLD